LWGSGKWAITKVQKYLDLNPDGIVGPKTIAAINNKDPKELF
jgi:predicted peptidoglycan domain